MALSLVTAPVVEPVSLAEAKLHLKVESDQTADDTLISALIVAARRFCEQQQGRAYLEQTWDLTLDAFPAKRFIEIPLPPLRSVTSVTYIDTAGATQTLATSEYVVDSKSQPGRVALAPEKSWPDTQADRVGAVTVRFVAGEGTMADDVAETVKQAMYLLIGHWYVNREVQAVGTVVAKIGFAVDSLLGMSPSHRWGH